MGEVPPSIRLQPLTYEHRRRFVEAEVANYADEQVRDSAWPPEDALARAAAELQPVLERELSDAPDRGQRVWSAVDPTGEPVGWLWITPGGDGSGRIAFLHQITVVEAFRRRGFGRTMLRALEELLAAEGYEELRLHVMQANRPARRLYEEAGYELIEEDARRRRLRKLLAPGPAGPQGDA